ncbi:MAG: cellobiose phosphorylase [Opitutaceae bacterium]|nr:cellobiose phosphorylase [Opitutaceae bacterium]
MARPSESLPVHAASPTMRVPAVADLGLVELAHAGGLRVQLTPAGALFALRHEAVLINQLLPSPGEAGLSRLMLRQRKDGNAAAAAQLVGPGLDFAAAGASAAWRGATNGGLRHTTTLRIHASATAWLWHVEVHNTGAAAQTVDVLLAHDLGLADEGAVRNNEAYTSQYIDLLPVSDAQLGWVILARQNQPASGGRHPWLAAACTDGAVACATDGWQFFGADHRLTGESAAARDPALPSRRLQYECALAALQSRPRVLAPGARTVFTFVVCFESDHRAASSQADVDRLRDLLSGRSFGPAPATGAETRAGVATPASLFASAAWLHGETASAADWEAWFPGARRHVETDAAGRVLSFFHGADTHVVAREKEAAIARPHGHILRSGESTWIDDAQFGFTAYAAGVFASQVYLGNPSFARLLPVMRNALGVTRSGGQRVFVRRGGAWQQLGIPSAFAMTPGEVRWIYRLSGDVIEARAWCSAGRSASYLELRVLAGPPQEFLVTHELVLGTAEYEHGGDVTVHADAGWIACRPDAASLVGQHEPDIRFAIAAAVPREVARLGGDEFLYPDGLRRSGAYVALAMRPAMDAAVILLGVRDGDAALAGAVAAARSEYVGERQTAHPPSLTLRLRHDRDPAVARLDDIIPWFNHNAAIHFAAPHGLEQYGGAAWGVRDVTQGSIEWLLAHGRLGVARRVLESVFSQQYVHDGTWPQWFMHAPYRFIQQAHSHGDVCFWPVKALCDYVEASNDLAFMDRRVGYTEAKGFTSTGPEETYWAHCDRVIAHAESRFVPGTSLVNYGDGDWDDTLQPADPAMRTRMVSAWTVALAYQTIHQLATVAIRAHDTARAPRLNGLLERIGRDFRTHLMPGGVVAGFLVNEAGGTRPLLHPEDRVTGIRYRLLPMTRAIIAGLFTPEEARRHLEIVERDLRFPDGVRLMSDPVSYRGGLEHWFKRADTAANVGREIGLQYVHAHIRYAEALARVGDAERLWWALQVVNPVALEASVPNAAPRQANVYFSSSDADFADRYEAAARWGELKAGRVAARGGWRLYSSGPGLYLHKLRACLLGVRESFGEVIFDPVLPRALDGLVATVAVCGHRVEITHRVLGAGHGPTSIVVNGKRLEGTREQNTYRTGGLRVPASRLAALLNSSENHLEIEV